MSFGIARVDVGAAIEQRFERALGALGVAAVEREMRCGMQRAGVAVVGCIDVGAGVEQRGDDFRIAERRGNHQCGAAAFQTLIDGHAVRNQRGDDRRTARDDGGAERGAAACGGLRRIGAVVEQEGDHIGMSAAGGAQQWRCALCVGDIDGKSETEQFADRRHVAARRRGQQVVVAQRAKRQLPCMPVEPLLQRRFGTRERQPHRRFAVGGGDIGIRAGADQQFDHVDRDVFRQRQTGEQRRAAEMIARVRIESARQQLAREGDAARADAQRERAGAGGIGREDIGAAFDESRINASSASRDSSFPSWR